MKKGKLLIMLIGAFLLLNTNVMSQATASAPASATIVTPIGITKMVDMNFGNIAVKGTAGTVVLPVPLLPLLLLFPGKALIRTRSRCQHRLQFPMRPLLLIP